jgi:hypothetical protein
VVAYSRGQGDSRAARRLNEPRPARVGALAGVPAEVEGVAVAVLREEWRVEDRWWTGSPVWRHYFELVLESGENVVVFHDDEGGWFRQKA